MENQLTKTSPLLTPLEKEVRDRFGVLPNFFRLTPENPEITENLWGFAKFAYIDNPLPSLFKERLFVYLSRFCEVRYCIARHAGFLNGLGRPAGDKNSQIHSVDDIVALITTPLPRDQKLTEEISSLLNYEIPIDGLPEPNSPAEHSIFACASHVFLQTASAPQSLDALKRVMGISEMQYLNLFLSFVRTAHYWTKLHPELKFEDDINNLLKTHQELAVCILRDPEAKSSQISEKMLDELLMLRQQSKKYEKLSNEHEELIKEYQASKEREQHQQKEILTQSTGRHNAEQKFQYLSESGLINIFFFTSDGKINDANESFVALMGCAKEELTNGTLSISTSVKTKEQIQASLEDLNKRNILAPRPVDFIDKNGNVIMGLFGAMKIGDNECVGFIVDISDLKHAQILLENSLNKIAESEQFLLGAVNLAELGTWKLNVVNNQIFLSESLRSWYGFESDEIDLENLFSQIHIDDRERIRSSVLTAYTQESGASFRERFSVESKITGRKRILESTGKTMFDEKGAPLTMVGTARDITVQQNLQLELEQQIAERTNDLSLSNEKLKAIVEELATSNSNLARSNEELAQYAYVASHDLQEPLRKIQTFTDILYRKSELPASDHEYVDKINRSAKRMSGLIKNLLEYSHTIQSEFPVQIVDLSQILKNVVKDFELIIEEKQALIEASELPVIEGVEFQINQLLYNLIGNSLKFSQPGIAPQITIACQSISLEDVKKVVGVTTASAYIDITITDNGIGIERQYSKQIFEIFNRLHGRETYAGSGIGLALCKRIATNHKGYIYVDSELGKGSTFHIILPHNPMLKNSREFSQVLPDVAVE